MAMMDFARLPMSVAVGLVVFQEMPDPLSALGMGIIAAASLLVIHIQRGAGSVAATGAGERKD
jgi:drug/metabolite transporter (DMT)-like permease